MLGDLPRRDLPISVETVSVQRRDKYSVEELILDINGMEQVSAYFIKPLDLEGPFPTVLFSHSHGENYALGKDEVLDGCPYLQPVPYAEALTKMGFAVLCIDSWCFGSRATRSESVVFKDMLWNGRVLWGMMVYDSLRALDYMIDRPDVDSQNIVTMGISMGATMSWWVAALDERIKACVDICCMTDFETFFEEGDLDRHGLYYYVPGLLKHFSTAGINALIAPRLHLSLVGTQDEFTPEKGLDRIDAELKKVYQQAGKLDNWELLRYNSGHGETPEMRRAIEAFLSNRVLGPVKNTTSKSQIDFIPNLSPTQEFSSNL